MKTITKLAIAGEVVPIGGGAAGGNENVYSTEETRVGTWIDGRPLYRRTINLKSPISGDTNSDVIALNDAYVVKNWYGYLETENGASVPLNYYNTTTNYVACWIFKPAGKHVIGMRTANGTNLTNRPVVITIEYTKTTDAPASAEQLLQSIADAPPPVAMPVTAGYLGSYNEEV